ncbi:DUF3421 domain-containing protein [Nostoc sp. FACHB-152]|uniref:DM9 repeat-containing protein n=1 Tax=unclassified Nostoc TaxID=2593658 RepID=UPI001683B608|nr:MULTISPECIES: DM9 repeat-containing protein [unclassified Nostoc]MBD2450000.1 DUF3421 domain-containing protein [Nostoc sp. FACHB-152]MBD2470120.1 DUF3421 domain-containing protein [Nostoc sp. FACHB-145]
MLESIDTNDQLFFTNINDEEAANTVGGVDWVSESYGSVPSDAILAGYENDGSPLYICRAFYNEGLHPGKVVGENCNIGWGGQEISLPYYEVLVY